MKEISRIHCSFNRKLKNTYALYHNVKIILNTIIFPNTDSFLV